MALTDVELKEIADKVGKETADKIQNEFKAVEKNVNEKMEAVKVGLMTQKDFESFKTDQLAPLNDTLEKLEKAMKEQGNQIASFVEKAAPNSKSLDEFLKENVTQIKNATEKKAYLEFTGEQLKAAGVYSIAGSIPTASPYAPGIGGAELNVFELARNPNFITSKVNLGRTNQARLAWFNELALEGGAAIVAEGALKPQSQHTFEVQTSTAKKVASWIEMTEEFEQDLPQLATVAQRLLNVDVVRGFDDAVQTDVQAAARPYNITTLNDKVPFANYWDAILAMMAQVGVYNFQPNTVAFNWITNAILKSRKNANGTYLLPSFADDIEAMTVYANKMANYYALVGDLQQYNVDIYKDYVLKIGWINDELIYNKFAMVGEMRYHSYISTARRNALVYDSLDTVTAAIDLAV